MDSDEAIRRADFARQVTDNPLFQEALDALDESLRRQRLAVKPTDTDGHTKLILAEQILGQFRAYLKRAITDGEVVQLELVRGKTLIDRVFAR
jgi:hypothetical protein